MLAYLLRFSYQFTVYLRDYIMSNENGKFLFHRENGTFVDTRKATKISIIDASSCVSMDKNPDRITVTGYGITGDNQAYPKPRKLTDVLPRPKIHETSRKPPPRSLTDISVDISIASSSQDASDELQFSPDGTTAFFEPWREFDTLEPLDLRALESHSPLSKLVTLVKVVRLQAVDYTIIPNQVKTGSETKKRGTISATIGERDGVATRRGMIGETIDHQDYTNGVGSPHSIAHIYIRAVVNPSKRKLGTCQLPILPYRQTIPMGTQGRKPEDVLQSLEEASNKESEDRRKENERLKEENKRLEEMVENGRKRLEELRIVIHCWIIDDLPQQIAENERKEKKRIEEELRTLYFGSGTVNLYPSMKGVTGLISIVCKMEQQISNMRSKTFRVKLGVWESVGLATGSPLVFIQVIGDFMKQTYVNQLAAISNSKVKLPVCGWLSDDREAVTSPFEAATPALFIAIPFLSGKSFKVYW
ncbi:hypothetical protein BU17DRAFT_69303 [Hysterangium stoloniferum]|nr:hypothetical protein BU17DRAFT_69303 [Hysterangium stoloniferum]